MNDNDEAKQDALFRSRGAVRRRLRVACSNEGREAWCRNLCPADEVAVVMSQWLKSAGYQERDPCTP
ncbi:hypothetical protein, partial [uncultured Sphingomonas sp.]|uniref:hypothetical protein n=1 Tax=uncultured Sphingomonas sp. TaxID=158754 RepID=UPI0025E23ABB